MPDTPAAAPPGAGLDPLAVALRKVAIFSDLEEAELQWFAAHAEDLHVPAGEILIREGDAADALFVLLEGEIVARRESEGPGTPVFRARAGQVTGLLPFSRMTSYSTMVRAAAPLRIARLHKDWFPEMLQATPRLLPRLVGVMADRIREFSRAGQQREKLAALGKLSAGLAHELNNPASAARRAAESLRRAMAELRQTTADVDRRAISDAQRKHLADFELRSIERLASLPALDALTQSDLEEEMSMWLQAHAVADSWKLAGGLVEAGISTVSLDALAAAFDRETIHGVLARVVATLNAEKLVAEIESATSRISELVRAIKEYTYMDQMPEQEVDIHKGLDSTLTMMKFRLKKGVTVIREYSPDLPRVCAHGSELNQVWTNLIDNAVDAMNGKGELRIRTARELDNVVVEITDNGTGIPPENKARIFEPFFTTKGVGDGTGLGLDTAYRIVRSHHGDITFDSEPGRTRFQVRLPLQPPGEGRYEDAM